MSSCTLSLWIMGVSCRSCTTSIGVPVSMSCGMALLIMTIVIPIEGSILSKGAPSLLAECMIRTSGSTSCQSSISTIRNRITTSWTSARHTEATMRTPSILVIQIAIGWSGTCRRSLRTWL